MNPGTVAFSLPQRKWATLSLNQVKMMIDDDDDDECHHLHHLSFKRSEKEGKAF